MEEQERQIYIIGHKNPDTDSICAAVSYAYIKNQITGSNTYHPRRAGQVNEETQFVLEKFGVEPPEYLSDVGTQVADIEVRNTRAVEGSISLKRAWEIMKEDQVVVLPIVKEESHLEGIITMGDLTSSYMDVYDNAILSEARTQYKNIVETLGGKMVVGNEHGYFTKGKVLIAAANPEVMEGYIETDDLIILGNRYESQFSAIEMMASCIIVCEGVEVSQTIQRLAEQRECVIISTPHDTFTVARLINQSIPIKYFMTKENLVTFKKDDFLEDVQAVMQKNPHRDFPVIDKKGNYLGTISRRNLLNPKRKQLILVDHNELSQAVDNIESATVLEIIDHHRIGSLETSGPAYFRNQPVGCTSTIMYQICCENQVEISPKIAGLLCAAIISDTLMFRSPTCTPVDKAAAEALSKIANINIEEFAEEMFRAGSNLKSKSPEEIFYQDFKKFTVGSVNFGVGQINSMDKKELQEIKDKLLPYMKKAMKEHGVSMLFFMLTSILDESTELICCGDRANEVIEEAFADAKAKDENSYILEGVVSRKKQIIPPFVAALQQ